MSLSVELKQLREYCKLSQREFAAAVHLCQSAISHYESQARVPGRSSFARILEFARQQQYRHMKTLEKEFFNMEEHDAKDH